MSKEIIAFYAYPSLSLIFIVLINRKIFKTFKDITSKNILIAIIIIIYLCYILSFIFHCLFTCPIIEKNNEIKNEKWNSKNNINIDKNIDNIKSKRYSENTIIKFSNKDNIKIDKEYHEEIIEIKQDKKKIYSTKICTLCGYIYLRKEIGDTKACVCYYYTNKCNWFLDIICKFEVITSILIEFNCQICIIGYKSLLSKKLTDSFSYSKNIIFLILFIFFSNFIAVMYVSIMNRRNKKQNKENKGVSNEKQNEEDRDISNGEKKEEDNDISNEEKKEEDKDLSNKKQNEEDVSNIQKQTFIRFLIFGYVFYHSFLTFISSLYYYYEDSPSRKRWDNIMMAELIIFKMVDMTLLSYFDFYDNSDIFNTSLFITLEKFLWMVIETILDETKINIKTLIKIQIIISSVSVFISFLYLTFSYIFLCIKKCRRI